MDNKDNNSFFDENDLDENDLDDFIDLDNFDDWLNRELSGDSGNVFDKSSDSSDNEFDESLDDESYDVREGNSQLIASFDDLDFSKPVLWNSAHLSGEFPFTGGYCDVYQQDLAESNSFNWVWTVEDYYDNDCLCDEEGNPLFDISSFVVAYDSTLKVFMKDSGFVVDGKPFFVPFKAELHCDNGVVLDLQDFADRFPCCSEEEAYGSYWLAFQPKSEEEQKDYFDYMCSKSFSHARQLNSYYELTHQKWVYDNDVVVCEKRQWTAGAISKGLSDWTEKFCGRRYVFVYAPDEPLAPMYDKVFERLENYKKDKELGLDNKVEIAPNVYVLGPSFEQLQNMSEEEREKYFENKNQ